MLMRSKQVLVIYITGHIKDRQLNLLSLWCIKKQEHICSTFRRFHETGSTSDPQAMRRSGVCYAFLFVPRQLSRHKPD